MVGIASFKGFFRKDLSDRLNTEAPTMGQAVESIATLLEKYGYQSESESQTTSTASAPKAIDPVVPVQSQALDTQGGAESSLFPPGLREEMEKSLLQQSITK